ncbi:MAG: hypothetical protein AB8B99_09775 [Phormidesmis sp.]
MTRQLLSALALTVATLSAVAPTAQATTFRFSTLQERSGETIVIEENAIENFRRQQRQQ